eukprot:TRINITY_DN6489_c0_g2_i1.p1 TRINITY_DN6489_c0_g2~~TRINITY_DN6489_c0_g2_i1.p1  ORF type:complete len:392 (+),score=84.62 TRINITY_DN6489_c0_g2_i1:42-1178(+)
MGKEKVKCNPVSRWHISSKKVTDFSFSQDGKYLAVTSHDGWLRIFDYAQERHLMSFKSYYAAFLTVAWSTDGRFLLTGGQDDLVSIWSFDDQCLVARCRGHSSFVTSVAFDPWSTYFDQTYVFGSVGQDCNLLIWEFSVGALHRSRKSTVSAASAPSPGNPNTPAGQAAGTRSHPSMGPPRDGQPVIVPAPGRHEVPVLGPIGEMRAHNDLCSQIIFLEGAVVTAAVDGNCKIWARPSKLTLWGRRAAARALGQRPPPSEDDDDLNGEDHGVHDDDADDVGRGSRGDTVDTSLTSDMHDMSVVSERSAGDIDFALRTPGQTPAKSRAPARREHAAADSGDEGDDSVPTPLRGMRQRDEEEKAARRRRQAERAEAGRMG